MTKKELLDFDVITPAKFLSFVDAQDVFGKQYKYDLPKWCAENELHCFYFPPTMMYLIFPMTLNKL